MAKAHPIDETDRRILAILEQDGRISWRDLAARIGRSLTPTLRRVRQLEEASIIRGYAARIERGPVIGEMTIFITVTMERQRLGLLDAFEARIREFEDIRRAYLVNGTADYLLEAQVPDLAHYRALLSRLTGLEGVAEIQSSFVLKAV